MATNAINRVIQHLRRTALRQDGAGLADSADADDAFQVTFLVLVRKAASIRPRGMVSNWPYGVAHNTALKAKAMNQKRRVKEKEAGWMTKPEVAEEVWRQLQVLLDEEMGRLPDKYRVPIVLCDLEGKTIKDAARHLQWPQGTVATRLAQARRMLAKRLAKQGLTLSGAALATLLSHGAASASVPPPLVISTIKAASLFAAGSAATPGVISTKVATLVEGVMKTMLLNKLKLATVALMILAAAGISVSVASHYAYAEQPSPSTRKSEAQSSGPGPAAVQQTQETWKIVSTLKGHEDPVHCLAFGPDDVLLSGGKDGHIRVWDATTGKVIRTLQNKGEGGGVAGFTYAPDASWVNFRFENGIALSFDKFMKDGKPVNIGPGLGFNDGKFAPLAMGPDGKTYAWRTEDKGKKVAVWFGYDLMQKVLGELTNHAECLGHEDEVLCADFSPDGELLATGSADKTARLWDAALGKEKCTLKGHKNGILVVAFAPDGKTLATGSKDGLVKLWDVATGKEKATLKGHDVARCLAFSPDGKTMASGGDDKTIKLWEVATGKELTTLKGHTDSVRSLNFNRGGNRLASAGLDKVVKIWEPKPYRLGDPQRCPPQERRRAALLILRIGINRLRGRVLLCQPFHPTRQCANDRRGADRFRVNGCLLLMKCKTSAGIRARIAELQRRGPRRDQGATALSRSAGREL
jgi:RNA polymerase sigma factor (sigma-70 family)